MQQDHRNENSYRSIIRRGIAFGGVQLLQIIIALLKGKVMAMLLGTEGMGVNSLFSSSSASIQKASSLGLNLALVKETSAASSNRENLDILIASARRLILFTSLVGALICLIFSRQLSLMTFGDESMRWQFMLLGVAVGLSVASAGQISLLQGLGKVRQVASTSIAGGLSGLIAGIPLYLWLGNHGIVPAMVVMSLTMSVASHIALRHAGIPKTHKWTWNRDKEIVKRLVALGSLLMANELLLSVVQYLINIFVNSRGSTETLGLYQAANSIISQYSAVVFAVMTMDFFPRLSKSASDNAEMRVVVNRQIDVTSLLTAPASILLILVAPLAVDILLTPEFNRATILLRWLAVGVMFRAVMLPLGYVSFAKGNRRLFFWMEGVGCNLLTLLLSCGGFMLFGLDGLGYAYVADNALCLIIYYVVCRRWYGFSFPRATAINIFFSLSIGIIAFISTFLSGSGWGVALGVTALLLSCVIAWMRLRSLRREE